VKLNLFIHSYTHSYWSDMQ